MKLHDLKVLPEYYKDIASGRKSFEARKNDRDFEVGDILRLREYHPGNEFGMVCAGYTGEEVLARIDYILYGGEFGIDKDFCVMAIRLWNWK